MAAKKRWIIGVSGFVLGLLGAAAYFAGPETLSAYRTGFFSREVKRDYQGDSVDNLRRLHTAMMLYHDSEGQFPFANGWMDAIENRLQTSDLKPGEGSKKLRNPVVSANPEAYGYAMNEATSAKYREDVPGGDATVLLFDSEVPDRNASGNPRTDRREGSDLAIRIDGKLESELNSKP